MRFNSIDFLGLLAVSTIGAVQFLRAKNQFSLVFYETLGLGVAARLAYEWHTSLTSFLVIFLVGALFALTLARILNNYIAFNFGIFTYLLGFFIGIGCGWIFGYVVLKSLALFFQNNEHITILIRKSWVASQILYFGVFVELLAVLRQAKYNIPGQY